MATKIKNNLEKQKRLEKALRENLRKRKIQQRERQEKEKVDELSELEKTKSRYYL